MKKITPKSKKTKFSKDLREWIPATFDDFLLELKHVEAACEGEDSCCLFRGQADYQWLLDSTFVRNAIKTIFKLTDHRKLLPTVRNTVAFNRVIASLLSFKCTVLCKPSEELLSHARETPGIDPWFEFLRDLQQNPARHKDNLVKGTFLLDWTFSKDVSLYFTVFKDWEQTYITPGHGALWVFDAGSTGRIRQIEKLGKIIDIMASKEFLDGAKQQLPLFFHPCRQTLHIKAIEQEAVYLSQMSYQCDIADVWATYEERSTKKVFLKLILKEELKTAAANYVKRRFKYSVNIVKKS